jgi:hypothetical protein
LKFSKVGGIIYYVMADVEGMMSKGG